MAAIDDWNTQMEFVGKMADFVNKSQSSLQGDLLVACQYANALCGFFALFYVANIVWKSWVNGGQIDLYRCFKPFVIGFLIINFNLVSGIVDEIASGFTKCSVAFQAKQVSKSKEQNEKWITEMKNLDSNGLVTKEKEEVTKGKELGANDGNGVKKKADQSWKEIVVSGFNDLTSSLDINHIMLSWQKMGQEFLMWIVKFLASLVSVCIIMIGFINRCVLIFFGPVMFALSLLPSADGMIMGWVRKYFTYSLYPAIVNIINGVMASSMCYAMSGIMGSTDSNSIAGGSGMELMYVNFALCGISLISIFLYMAVPSVAGQIVDVTGNVMGASAGAAINYGTSKAMSKFGGTKLGQAMSSGAKNIGASMATGGLSSVYQAGSAIGSAIKNRMSGGGKKEASGDSYKGGSKA